MKRLMRLGEWVWSATLAFLLATFIAVWLEFYPDLPDWVKVPIVAKVTAVADWSTEVAGKAAGGLLTWLVFPIQFIKGEVKGVIFAKKLDQREAAVKKKEAAVAEERAAVAEKEAAVAEERAAVAEKEAAVAEERAAVLEWYEQHKEQLPDVPPPPGVTRSGYNGNGATPE